MAINSGHITGFFIGMGAAVGGFIAYKKNQERVDAYLGSKGITVPGSSSKNTSNMSLEELIAQKEELEDLIAEREYAAKQEESKKESAKE